MKFHQTGMGLRRIFPQLHISPSLLLFLGVLTLSGCISLSQGTAEGEEHPEGGTALHDSGPESSPTTDQVDLASRKINIPEIVPDVDMSQANVPLNEIYFDTFQPVNRAVPLNEASPDLIGSLRDAIPPIHTPKFEPAETATWLSPGDMVLGYSEGDQAWAFPIRILNFHEIVNTNLGGTPLLISYCPLCYSGIVFHRVAADQELVFGNTSALYQSDMVMFDYQTGSYWWQLAGEAIVGDLTGETLDILPSKLMSWKAWLDAFPTTQVLSRDTGYDRSYAEDPFLGIDEHINRGQFVFPVSEVAFDNRLRPGDKVVSIQGSELSVAYLLDPIHPAVYNDEFEDLDIVVFSNPDGPGGAAYNRNLDGTVYTFSVAGDGYTDQETESTWNLAGKAVEGPLRGSQLEGFPARTSFWYAIVAAEPEIRVIAKPKG